jgi:hypothetical protein
MSIGRILKGLKGEPALESFERLIPLDNPMGLLAYKFSQARRNAHLLKHARQGVPMTPQLPRGLGDSDVALPPLRQPKPGRPRID